MFIQVFSHQLRKEKLTLKMSRMYSSYIQKKVIVDFESQYDSIFILFGFLYLKIILAEKTKWHVHKVEFLVSSIFQLCKVCSQVKIVVRYSFQVGRVFSYVEFLVNYSFQSDRVFSQYSFQLIRVFSQVEFLVR